MLAERDKKMSESRNFMSALDQWSEEAIIEPLAKAFTTGMDEIRSAKALVKKAIREKVLESYHNGQNAAPKASQRPYRGRK